MTSFHLQCSECGATYQEHGELSTCPVCSGEQIAGGTTRGILEVVVEDLPGAWPATVRSSGLPESAPLSGPSAPAESVARASAEAVLYPWDRRFVEGFLPVQSSTPFPPLPVGATPLLASPMLRAELGMAELWLKDDTRNPSGSTKDRASWLVVAKALEYGYETVAAASTGNAATALAAVAVSSGVRAVVFVPEAVPEAKLTQMLCYGAEVVPVAGTYDDAFELCLAACEEFGWYNRNTALNPFTIEGKKTAAIEIAVQLGGAVPDVVLVPTGDGVILSGIAKGFADLQQAGLVSSIPRLVAVQPEGSSAIVASLEADGSAVEAVSDPHSVADSLVVAAPRCALLCLRRIRESGGTAVRVSDRHILASIPRLAGSTGVFAEPAAAAALAGLEVVLERGLVARDERVVLLLTGSGLKDIPAASRSVERPIPVEATLAAVTKRFGIR